MGLDEFELQVVHRVPMELKAGTLYVCFDCNVVVHLCACGCGEKVVLPIDPDCWSVNYDGESVSLTPSIGNFQFACKAHYWIRKNKIIWADPNPTSVQKKTKKRKKKSHFMDRIKSLF